MGSVARPISFGLIVAGALLGLLAVALGENGVISWEAGLVPDIIGLFLVVCAVCHLFVTWSADGRTAWLGIGALSLGGTAFVTAPGEILGPDCLCPPHPVVPALFVAGMVWVGCGAVAAIACVVRSRRSLLGGLLQGAQRGPAGGTVRDAVAPQHEHPPPGCGSQ